MDESDFSKYFDDHRYANRDVVGFSVSYTLGGAVFNSFGGAYSDFSGVNAVMISIPMTDDDHDTQARILRQAFKRSGVPNFLYGHNGRFYLEKKLLPEGLQYLHGISWLRDCHRSAVVKLNLKHEVNERDPFEKIKHRSYLSILFHKDFLTTEEILEKKTFKLSRMKTNSDLKGHKDKDTSRGSAFPLKVKDKVYFLTAKHVLENLTEPKKVELRNASCGALYGKAGKESKFDAQLVEVESFSGESFEIGRFEHCELGDEIYVAGFPANLGDMPTISLGHISKLNADYDGSTGLIQISSAAVNPNNSGGPVTDYQGNVIGILVMRADPKGQYQNIAFVEPIERVLADLSISQ